VLDSYALIGYLENESFSEKIQGLLSKAKKLINYIDEELLLAAATLKANYPISYADSFAAALAMIKKCSLLTGDPEFELLEKQGIITIEWLI
jgi:predicted nucleic acid-binding protein